MKREQAIGKVIDLDGDRWEVIGAGAEKDGDTFCHLASTTRFNQHKNGKYPVQSCQFVSDDVLSAA